MTELYDLKPLSPLRRVIGARMSEAKSTIPHFRVKADVDVGRLVQARILWNGANPGAKISFNDCLVKAAANALEAHRDINIRLEDGTLRHYRDAHISVVVAVPGGLSTPTLRDVNRKGIRQIALETRELIARAKDFRLRMDEIEGGSFSISNLGAYDVDEFDAIINPPQCAILAAGRIRDAVKLSEEGTAVAKQAMTLTLSVDHRAIDGAQAGLFLKTLRQQLEHEPEGLFDG